MSLVFTFHPDATETVRASKEIQRRAAWGWVTWLPWPILVGLLILYGLGGVPWSEMGLLYLAAAFLIFLKVVAPWWQARQLRREYSESAILSSPQQYEFRTDGLVIHGGPAESSFSWEAIREVAETADFFIFYLGKRHGLYLPQRAVPSEQERESLRGLLRQSLGRRFEGRGKPATTPATA